MEINYGWVLCKTNGTTDINNWNKCKDPECVVCTYDDFVREETEKYMLFGESLTIDHVVYQGFED